MAKRRKRRTSIRTAAGTTQKQYLARMRQLRDDPTRVLPTVIGPEPKPLAKIRARLERMRHKKPSWFDRRDKGMVGAVAQALPLAEMESIARLLDHKVAGKRRFYTVRGHASRACAIAAQNHDDPRCLAQGYGELAKQHGLHFFAMPEFWCTGGTPQPPQEWIDALAKKADIDLEPHDDGWTCRHHDEARLRLRFHDGPAIAVCGRCGKKAGNLHGLVTARYRGPRERRPVGVDVLFPDGSAAEPKSRDVAAYRARVKSENELIVTASKQWRAQQRATGQKRYVLGEKEYPHQEAFLDALGGEPWEGQALQAMTEKGHASGATSIAGVLEAIPEQWPRGLDAILGKGQGTDFLAAHIKENIRDILRKAHEQANVETSLADLPTVHPSGPIGAWLDDAARSYKATGKRAALQKAGHALERNEIPDLHVAALVAALGGDIALERRLPQEAREAAEELKDAVQAALDADGEAYAEALQAYLEQSGSGERL